MLCVSISDEMEGGDAESDEAALAELRQVPASGPGAVQRGSALEGVLVLRIAEKRLLEGCLRELSGTGAGKASKRKR